MSIEVARTSLVGLAVGDAFGSMLDGYGDQLARRAAKRLISMTRPWRWTDDTAMAVSVFEQLAERGAIDPDALAEAFARRFASDPNRGYGAGAYALLGRVSLGAPWRQEAQALFRGKGSYGNGAAMRAAPVGAFFAPDLERVRVEARRTRWRCSRSIATPSGRSSAASSRRRPGSRGSRCCGARRWNRYRFGSSIRYTMKPERSARRS